jgi:hypothetical protein
MQAPASANIQESYNMQIQQLQTRNKSQELAAVNTRR